MSVLADLIGESDAMNYLRRDIRRLLAGCLEGRRLPAVLIEGETGTGKGLVARIIHSAGPRAGGPFVDVNCAAIPETLLESELFGFERGAFTDARRQKPGLFQTAHRGVLFLDEVGLLPEVLQAKMLTVLEEHSVRRLGATRSEPVDVWVLSATNVDLRAAVRRRRFRDDFYHRLTVLTLRIPPLRDRGRDILLLAERFLARACHEYRLPTRRITSDAEARLLSYRWPGNVRELSNVVERVALLSERDLITADMLGVDGELTGGDDSAAPLDVSAGAAARKHLQATLERTGWNISRTAAALGLARNTVRARIERWGLRHARVACESPPAVAIPGEALGGALWREGFQTFRWQRRPVTFVRVALVLVDTEDFPDTSRKLEHVVEKIRTFGGRVEEVGQAVLDATFGLEPIEDAPSRAANAVLAIVKGVAGGGETPHAVRAAMHAATVVVAYTAGRPEVDREDKRRAVESLEVLVSSAEPGAIHVSAAVGSLLDRRFEVVSQRLLGRSRTGLGLWGRIGRLVGRRADLELLETRWSAAVRGSGQVVGIVGEPGVGKSRLLWEFTRALAPTGRVICTAAAAHGTPTPYLTLTNLLRDYFAVEGAGASEAGPQGILAGLMELDRTLTPLLPAILALLDVPSKDAAWQALDPHQRRQRTLDSVKALLLRESRRRPVALLIEDAQWLDSESQAVLDALIDGMPTAPLLLLVSYRPEYRHAWGSKTYYTQLRVDPLDADSAATVLRALLGTDPSLAGLVSRVIEWSGGNPLFFEETVRNLVGTGALVGEWGDYRLAVRVPELQVPRTVQEVLVSRIDRLVPEQRALLDAAAVIGREVPYAMIAAVVAASAELLHSGLNRLRDAELLHETSSFGPPEYTFKQAVIHDVAYEGVAEPRRRDLHASALAAMEILYADRLEERIDDLARHAFEGHSWAKAVEYLRRAGAKAFSRYANRPAARHFERALVALAHLPKSNESAELEIDMRFALRNALTPLGELARTLQHLEAARVLAEHIGDSRRLGRVYAFMANALYQMGEQRRAIAAGEAALKIAETLGDVSLKTAAQMYVGRAWLLVGQYARAIEMFEGVTTFLTGPYSRESLGLPVLPAVFARSHLAVALAETGAFERAETVTNEAVELAEATKHPDTILWAYRGIGLLHLSRGDASVARAVLERAHQVCRANDLTTYVPPIASALGAALVDEGRVPEGVVLLEEAVALATELKQVTNETEAIVRLGRGQLALGEPLRALESADRALALAQVREERGTAVHALHLRAAALFWKDQAAAAETYQLALAEAETLDMQPLAAKIKTGLAALKR